MGHQGGQISKETLVDHNYHFKKIRWFQVDSQNKMRALHRKGIV